jgi:hypothetical protein
MILCDSCDRGFHMACLNPVLNELPIGDWLCDGCCATGASAKGFVRTIPTNKTEIQLVEHERTTSCRLSSVDIAAGLALKDDGRVALGNLPISGYNPGGYRSVRATRGISAGSYYWEALCVHGINGNSGHCRVGFAQQWSDLELPVGADELSYALSSSAGCGVHLGVRTPLGTPFSDGDVVGMQLYLPPGGRERKRTREAVYWGNKLFWIEEGFADEPKVVKGSFIAWSVNGRNIGKTRNLLEGTYFPCVSIFTLPQSEPVEVRCNFNAQELCTQPRRSKPWSEAS